MKFTKRDQLLILILPLILVLGIYGWFISPGKLSALKKVETALADAKAKAPAPEILAAKKKLVAQAAGELASLQGQLDALQKQWRNEASRCSTYQRSERQTQLKSLFLRHGLGLLTNYKADAAKEGKLSPALEQLAKDMADLGANQKPELHLFSFKGRFGDVQRALEELGQGDLLALPIRLIMKDTKDHSAPREWELYVWI